VNEPPAKRRLLAVIKSDGVGGVERFLSGMIPAFAAREIEVDLVGHGHPPPRPGLLADRPITTLTTGRLPGLPGRVRQALALRRMIARGEYAAVIGFGPVANGLVSLARRRSGPLVVVCERTNPFIDGRRTWNRWFGWTYRRADVLVVQTEGLADEVRSSWKLAQVAVIRNPIPAAVPLRPPSERRDPVIAAVGRLLAKKGFSDLIEALAKLGQPAAGWSLMVVGDGSERVELEAQAARLGVGDRVVFAGTHPEPWELLANASIFVLCSQHEGYPNALLEAMASGCAVVAADCRYGPSEMIEHQVSGLLYPVGDVDRLARHLDALVRDPAMRLSLARESTAWASRQTTDEAVTRWLELIAAPGVS
jgi:GalNAc-alpha-(1->4)-GalNAc-alpha-(1->3)-diNAcBac-PP-undecaprenol alpha-1,4-N-acetyl-D-galactosaminyltransferase